jgi:hypothetical protein
VDQAAEGISPLDEAPPSLDICNADRRPKIQAPVRPDDAVMLDVTGQARCRCPAFQI